MPDASFKFHQKWQEVLSGLPPQVRLEVYDAIIEYGLSGTLIELKATAGLAFAFIKSDMDADKVRYEAICRRNRENGCKSNGRPKTQKNPRKPKKPTGLSNNKRKQTKPLEKPLRKGVSEEKPTGLFGFFKDQNKN